MTTKHLKQLSQIRGLPQAHTDYLRRLKESGVEPRIIYDIGACVLHWTHEANKIWPDAEIIVFDAFEECAFLYKEEHYKYHAGVLSHTDGSVVKFYQNNLLPGGNSYYRENSACFPESCAIEKITSTLDTVVRTRKFPLPDFIKIDVQGAEKDILIGASSTLKNVHHLIVEMQRVDYNAGAPKVDETLPYIESLGFKCIAPLFCDNGPDGDYHFARNTLYEIADISSKN